ncbi:MAG TPA: hypothetical protein VG276_19930 [Actinomycetes bacterium]|nr:hypothetical protein [Actinomycetes bacterium]
MALLDRQQHPAGEPVGEPVAAAQDDPPRPGADHDEVAELPQARPPGPSLPARDTAAAGGHAPAAHQPPHKQHRHPDREDQRGVHADRAR